jgi:hypothetical protein
MSMQREPRTTLPLGIPTEVEPAPEVRPSDLAPITTQDYVEKYAAEGARLCQGGVLPSSPPSEYVAAYPRLRAFLRQHGDPLSVRGVVSAEVDAGEGLVQRLSELLDLGTPEHAGADEEACYAAARRLMQLRDAVRRVLRGPEAAPLRERLGIDRPLKVQSVTAVLRALEQFLAVLREYPERLVELRLIPADLDQLEEHRSRLIGMRRTAPPPVDPSALLRAHLAVEAYFASLGAAIAAAFPEGDPRRIAGLRLIPRNEERRHARPAPRLWRASHPSTDE